jgi:hypothetical protein
MKRQDLKLLTRFDNKNGLIVESVNGTPSSKKLSVMLNNLVFYIDWRIDNEMFTDEKVFRYSQIFILNEVGVLNKIKNIIYSDNKLVVYWFNSVTEFDVEIFQRVSKQNENRWNYFRVIYHYGEDGHLFKQFEGGN